MWDNDGVLVDTEAIYFRANREICEEEGFTLSPETFARLSLGEGRSVFDPLRERGLGDDEIEALRQRRNERYSALLTAGAPVRPGIRETLRALHRRIPMAIVTSSRPDHFAQIHERSGLLPYFDFVLTSADYTHHKPHPEPYQRALERIGAAPEGAVVIEDSERGLASARAAGVRCVVLPSELAPDARYAGASARCEDGHALRALLLGWLDGEAA